MSLKFKFTVFTPTYNRAHTLARVYDSLCEQTFRDFEWLVVDDGSSDGTRGLIEKWQKQAWFPIRYFFKENGGKHTAINLGVKEARGYFFLTLDSDDSCLPDALEKLYYYWKTIPEGKREDYSAVTGLCRDCDGKVVGDRFPEDIFDSEYLSNQYIYKIKGEKWGFQRTDIMREFPFPEPSLRLSHFPEGCVWGAIAQKYKTRYVNEVLRIYFDDGPGQSLVRQDPASAASPGRLGHAFALNHHLAYFSFAPFQFFRFVIQFTRFSFHDRIPLWRQFSSLKRSGAKVLWFALWGGGLVLFLLDRWRFPDRCRP